MVYDHRRKVVGGQYDKILPKARSAAKARWGTGWSFLSDEQQKGALALEVIRLLGVIDFRGAVEAKLHEDDPLVIVESLLQKLEDITELFTKAVSD